MRRSLEESKLTTPSAPTWPTMGMDWEPATPRTSAPVCTITSSIETPRNWATRAASDVFIERLPRSIKETIAGSNPM